MFALIFPTAVHIANLLLFVVIATFLVAKYLRTRDVGFVWLGIAVVIWPWLARWSYYALWRHCLHAPHSRLYPEISVFGAQMSIGSLLQSVDELGRLVGLALILVSVLCLSRRNIKPPAVGGES